MAHSYKASPGMGVSLGLQKARFFSSRSFNSRTATEAGYRRAVCSRSEHKENRPQAGLAGEGFTLGISWTFSQPPLALWLRLPRQRERRYDRPSPGARERSEKRASDLTGRTQAKRATGLTADEANGRRAVCLRTGNHEKGQMLLSPAAGRVDGREIFPERFSDLIAASWFR